jgi:hypothetical protein
MDAMLDGTRLRIRESGSGWERYEEMNPNTDRYPLRPQWMEGE